MRIWEYLTAFAVFETVAAFHGRPSLRMPSSGFRRMTSSSLFRPIRQSLFPRYQSFDQLGSSRPIFRYDRRRFFGNFDGFNNFDNFNNFNNFNDFDNNGGRFPSIFRGFPRRLRGTGSRITPRRIRIPLSLSRGFGGSTQLNPIPSDRRIRLTQGSRLPRVSRGRLSPRRTTGRKITEDMHTRDDQVLALFAVDDLGTSQSVQGSRVDIPVASEMVATGTSIKRVPVRAGQKTVASKETIESKITKTKAIKKESKRSKSDELVGTVPELLLTEQIIDTGRAIGGGVDTETTKIASKEVKETVAKIQKKNTVDVDLREALSKAATTKVDKKKDVVAMASEAGVTKEAIVKSDIKVSDADTVNIKAETIVAKGDGAAIPSSTSEEKHEPAEAPVGENSH